MAPREPGIPAPLKAMRVTARAVGNVQRQTLRVRTLVAKAGFPYRAPTVPRGVEVLPKVSRTGSDFETDWARRPAARAARRMIVNGPMRGALRLLANPERTGIDRLRDLLDADPVEPVVFVSNHHSHLDAGLMLTSIPEPWRSKIVVGAAADYFFTTRLTGAASALALGAFPIERTTISRRSSDLAADLIDEGYSLLIFPEGGRSPDGWGQPFKGGAAYLAERCDVAVIPAFIDGAGAILGKGMSRPKRGRTKITFGTPIRAREGENVRRLNERIERAVALLGDESLHDYYGARLRAARGATPSLHGPEMNGWRRAWALADHRARGMAGKRRRQKRRWPKLS
jgi:1-acyl-sn-glycerol-3-phosphate acyltransferase